MGHAPPRSGVHSRVRPRSRGVARGAAAGIAAALHGRQPPMKNIFSTSLRHLCSHRVRLGVALGLALAGGCDPEEPIEARLCNRLDSCNFFGAGVSEGDCTDVMTMCSDGLVTSAKT